jgi:hypothetical protein
MVEHGGKEAEFQMDMTCNFSNKIIFLNTSYNSIQINKWVKGFYNLALIYIISTKDLYKDILILLERRHFLYLLLTYKDPTVDEDDNTHYLIALMMIVLSRLIINKGLE